MRSRLLQSRPAPFVLSWRGAAISTQRSRPYHKPFILATPRRATLEYTMLHLHTIRPAAVLSRLHAACNVCCVHVPLAPHTSPESTLLHYNMRMYTHMCVFIQYAFIQNAVTKPIKTQVCWPPTLGRFRRATVDVSTEHIVIDSANNRRRHVLQLTLQVTVKRECAGV